MPSRKLPHEYQDLPVRSRLALLVLITFALAAPNAQAASPFTWSQPRSVDQVTPYGHWQAFSGVACPSTNLCVAVTGNQIVTSTDPAGGPGAWNSATLPTGEDPTAISCPSTSQCVATDADGSILSSTDPTGGAAAWHRSQVEPSPGIPDANQLSGLSCPSTTLCAARDFSGNIVTSTDPTGGSSAWKITRVSGGHLWGGMYCPTQSLCLSGDLYGDLEVSTDPAGGSSAWHEFNLSPTPITGLVCPSASLCVGSDNAGEILSSTNPAGGAGAWKAVHVEPTASGLGSVSCPTASLCVAASGSGDVISSNDPTGSAGAWHHAKLATGGLGLTCPDSSTCVGFDASGQIVATHDPTGGASAWTTPGVVDPPLLCGPMCQPPQQQVACPSAGLCVMVDGYGRGYASTNPAAGAHDWATILTEGGDAITSLTCPTNRLCVGIDDGYRLLSSRDPAQSSPAWRVFPQRQVSTYRLGTLLSCASATFCLGLRINFYGSVQSLSATRPGDGPGAWRTSTIRSLPLTEVDATSCPTRHLCIGATYSSGVFLSTDPHSRRPHWRHVRIPGSHQLRSISCPSASFCAAGSTRGFVFTSTDPRGGSSTWHGTRVDTTSGGSNPAGEPFHALQYMSCPSRHLCVAVDPAGNVFSSAHPTGGRRAWKEVRLRFQPTASISCPSKSLCAIPAPGGVLALSHRPRGAASTWSRTTIDPGGTLTALSCPSNRLCFAGDNAGNVIVGRARS